MRVDELTEAYLAKASARLRALDFYKSIEAYSDVVHEAYTVVELSLMAVLRASGAETAIASGIDRTLEANKGLLPPKITSSLAMIRAIAKRLRKEQELSLYGAEDFVPTQEYGPSDADQAIEEARTVLGIVEASIYRINR